MLPPTPAPGPCLHPSVLGPTPSDSRRPTPQALMLSFCNFIAAPSCHAPDGWWQYSHSSIPRWDLLPVPPIPVRGRTLVLQGSSSLGLSTAAPWHIQPQPALFPKNPLPQLASMVSQASPPLGNTLSVHSLPQVTLLHPHPGFLGGLEGWPLTPQGPPPPGFLGKRFRSKSVALGCRAGWVHFLLSEKPHPCPVQTAAPNC